MLVFGSRTVELRCVQASLTSSVALSGVKASSAAFFQQPFRTTIQPRHPGTGRPIILVAVQSVERISHVERISVEICNLHCQLYASADSDSADSDLHNLDHAGVSCR